ncbi:MAG: hemerythrin domain-containing protein [Nocardioides sp.]
MPDVGFRVFSPARDARMAEAMVANNAETLRTLRAHVEGLVTVVSARASRSATRHALDRLVGWCRTELVPHAEAEECTLYRPARDTEQGELLVDGMLEEHQTIYRLVDELAHEDDPVRAVALAGALEAVVTGHLAKEDEQLLPLLVHSPYIALAEALEGLAALVGAERAARTPA